jgi:hypothetical protein
MQMQMLAASAYMQNRVAGRLSSLVYQYPKDKQNSPHQSFKYSMSGSRGSLSVANTLRR